MEGERERDRAKPYTFICKPYTLPFKGLQYPFREPLLWNPAVLIKGDPFFSNPEPSPQSRDLSAALLSPGKQLDKLRKKHLELSWSCVLWV